MKYILNKEVSLVEVSSITDNPDYKRAVKFRRDPEWEDEIHNKKSFEESQRQEYLNNGWQLIGKKFKLPKKDADKWEDEVWSTLYGMEFKSITNPKRVGRDGKIVIKLGQKGQPAQQPDHIVFGEHTATLVECKSGASGNLNDEISREKKRIDLLKKYLVQESKSAGTEAKKNYFKGLSENVRSVIWYRDENKKLTSQKREEASALGVVLLTLSDLEYFQAITDLYKNVNVDGRKIPIGGELARLQFRSIIYGGKALRQNQIVLPCTENRSSADLPQYHFTIDANFLLNYSMVQHRKAGSAFNGEDFKEGYQRLIDKRKIGQLAEHIDRGLNPDYHDFPNNLILGVKLDGTKAKFTFKKEGKTGHYKSSSKLNHGQLTITPAYGMFKIIDGQHRLFSFLSQPEEWRKNVFFSVTAFKDLALNKEMDLFVNINTKQTKINSADYLLLSKNMYAGCDRFKEFERLRHAIVANLLTDLDGGTSVLACRFSEFRPGRTSERYAAYGKAKIKITGPFRELSDQKGYFKDYDMSSKEAISLPATHNSFGPLWINEDNCYKKTSSFAQLIIESWFDAVASKATSCWDEEVGTSWLPTNDGFNALLRALKITLEGLQENGQWKGKKDPKKIYKLRYMKTAADLELKSQWQKYLSAIRKYGHEFGKACKKLGESFEAVNDWKAYKGASAPGQCLSLMVNYLDIPQTLADKGGGDQDFFTNHDLVIKGEEGVKDTLKTKIIEKIHALDSGLMGLWHDRLPVIAKDKGHAPSTISSLGKVPGYADFLVAAAHPHKDGKPDTSQEKEKASSEMHPICQRWKDKIAKIGKGVEWEEALNPTDHLSIYEAAKEHKDYQKVFNKNLGADKHSRFKSELKSFVALRNAKYGHGFLESNVNYEPKILREDLTKITRFESSLAEMKEGWEE